ncbi:AraC-like DNA-binding protein [Salibacterium salarium]|uniref:helix-turn-helix domain-containing protein n=1 Tax=Salibacterium salarium TaxID=284579 RepID=UPI00277DEE04|nr:AraC family transcriptional regulator [Salibacterium salarium]MDQ0297910.1 AraC-like DNA-binding protein [Salibacterium salarium]
MTTTHTIYDIGKINVQTVYQQWNPYVKMNACESMMVYVMDGYGEWKGESRRRSVKKGDVFALSSQSKEQEVLTARVPLEIFTVMFTCARAFRVNDCWYIEQVEKDVLQNNGMKVSHALTGYYLEQLYKTWKRNQKQTVQKHFKKVMETVVKANVSTIMETEDDIAAIKNYIDEHYDEAIPIHKLVQFSGMNTSLFYRKFKHYTGFTPLQYITNTKITEAKKLLASTSMKIADVAHEVGYEDSYYFSRMFKRTVGVSPQQYIRGKAPETLNY